MRNDKKYATWDDQPFPSARPVKPALDPMMLPDERVAALEQQRRTVQQAEQARIAAEQAPKQQLAQVDQELRQARAEQARAHLNQARELCDQDRQANQTASDETTNELQALVEALKNGGEIKPLASIKNGIDATFKTWLKTATDALAAYDAWLTAASAQGDPHGQPRPDAFMLGMMEAERQIGPAALPSRLALSRWITSVPAGSLDRTLRCAVAFAASGDPSMLTVPDGVDWQAAANNHAKGLWANMKV